MGAVKLTKNDLKRQKDQLRQFERYLPTLQLKKQQLQMVIMKSAAELEKATAEARKMLQQQVEQLQKERGQLEKQLYRARATGDGYAQIRFRTLLEQNREALEKLIPKQ